MMALDDLEAADYNPRTISDEALEGLKASIETFGLVQPIVWNERTKRIVGGHQRVEAMRQQGATEAMVVVVDFDETKERLLNLTLNNAAIAGEFTPAALEQLRELEEEAGFAALRLEDLMLDLGGRWDSDIDPSVEHGDNLDGIQAVIKVTCLQDDKERLLALVQEAVEKAGIDGVTVT